MYVGVPSTMPGPTALLPGGDSAPSHAPSTSVPPAPSATRLQVILDEVKGKRVPLLIAAGLLMVGLIVVVTVSMSGHRPSVAPSERPSEAPAPAPSEEPPVPAPSVGEPQADTLLAEPKAQTARKPGGSAEERRDVEGRSAPKRRSSERTQPKKEVRGFIDF